MDNTLHWEGSGVPWRLETGKGIFPRHSVSFSTMENVGSGEELEGWS